MTYLTPVHVLPTLEFVSPSLPATTLAEANERILEGMRLAGDALEDAALTYSQVVTEGLWKQGFETQDDWERWLKTERRDRKIPNSTWYFWLTIVGYLSIRGFDPNRLRSDIRPYVAYKAAKAEGYSNRRRALPPDELPLPKSEVEKILTEASREADRVWPEERPYTAQLDRMVEGRRQEKAKAEATLRVTAWMDVGSDKFGTVWLKNVDTEETHGFGIGHLDDLPEWFVIYLTKQLGIKEE